MTTCLIYTDASKLLPLKCPTGDFLPQLHFVGYITPFVYSESPVFAAIHLLYFATRV